MARHNRDGSGTDQHDERYRISYQPDWLRHVKVTRQLDNGRQSTKTLFKNPTPWREAPPGDRVRTRILAPEHGLDVEIAVIDPGNAVTRVRVTCELPGSADGEEVEFTLECGLPPAPGT